MALAEPPTRFESGPKQRLLAARANWEGQHISQYRFTIRRTAFLPTSKVRIDVRGNVVVRAIFLENDGEFVYGSLVPQEAWDFFCVMTVPGLFNLAEAKLKDATLYANAEYDPQFGYPVRLSFEPGSMFPPHYDAQDGYSVSDFKVIK
jgi:hypothetical protein